MNCPHCKNPLKIVVYPQKTTSNSGLLQLVSNSIRDFVPEPDDPFVRLITMLDGKMNIDELEITNSEFERVARATRDNGWMFSVPALIKSGGFTQYRAREIADNLTSVGLRYVTDGNRSILLPRLMSHLRDAL